MASNEINIDDYAAGNIPEEDRRRVGIVSSKTNPSVRADDDADDFDDDGYDEPEVVIPDAGPKRTGNREQRRAAARDHRVADDFPIEREANGITVVAVPYDGETYWVPTDPADWRSDATRAFEDGKAMTALEYILEPDEKGRPGYALLESKHYRMNQINELFDKIAKAGGFESSGN